MDLHWQYTLFYRVGGYGKSLSYTLAKRKDRKNADSLDNQ